MSSSDNEDSYDSYSSEHLSHSSSMDFLTYRLKHAEQRRMKAKPDESEHEHEEVSSFYGTYSTYDSYDETSKTNEESSEPTDPYFQEAIRRQKALQDIFHNKIRSFRIEVETLRHYPDARFLHEGINAGLNSIEYNCQNRYVQETIKHDYQLGYDRAFLIRTELMDKYKTELGESVLMQMIYTEMRKVIPQIEIDSKIEQVIKQENEYQDQANTPINNEAQHEHDKPSATSNDIHDSLNDKQ